MLFLSAEPTTPIIAHSPLNALSCRTPTVVRFMRFGVTSVTGLIAGLLSPFAAFMRTPTLQAIGATLLVSFLVFVYLTLQAMQSNIATPVISAPIKYEGSVLRSNDPPPDPSMKKMLQDIYGE